VATYGPLLDLLESDDGGYIAAYEASINSPQRSMVEYIVSSLYGERSKVEQRIAEGLLMSSYDHPLKQTIMEELERRGFHTRDVGDTESEKRRTHLQDLVNRVALSRQAMTLRGVKMYR
jgi:phage replication-related protein YjqB (UPF0714/DUF867 family)